MKRLRLILILFLVGVVQMDPIDIDLGTECNGAGADCSIVWDKELCGVDNVTISTPDYPKPMTNYEYFRTYTVKLRSCQDSRLILTLREGFFSLQDTENSFVVGDGNVVDSAVIPPRIVGPGDDSSNLPDGGAIYTYTSSSNQMWIKATFSNGLSASFSVQVSVLTPNIHSYYYKSSTGTISSPNYKGSYPTADIEERHFIDVVGSSEDVDLLFTVKAMDVNGNNGDYIKLGKGTNYLDDKHSTLLSWTLKKDYQFLIEGTKAHLIFKAFSSTDQPTNKGFQIHYNVIDKILTTPAPVTTPEPTEPTPLPFDSEILQQTVVFLNYGSSRPLPDLLEIFNEYVESDDYPSEGSIQPPLSDKTVIVTDVVSCYHGWNVDFSTCKEVHVQVYAFFVPSDPHQAVEYALTKYQIREAVSRFGNDQIKLPSDLEDVYTWSLGFSLGVCVLMICFVGVIFFVTKTMKQKSKIADSEKYSEVNNKQSGVANPAFVEFDPDLDSICVNSDRPMEHSWSAGSTFRDGSSLPGSEMYELGYMTEIRGTMAETDEVTLYEMSGPPSFKQTDYTQNSTYCELDDSF